MPAYRVQRRRRRIRPRSNSSRLMLYFTRWKAAAILLTALVVCLFAVPNSFPEDGRELAGMGAAPRRARPRSAGRLAYPARGRFQCRAQGQARQPATTCAASCAKPGSAIPAWWCAATASKSHIREADRTAAGTCQAARVVAAAGRHSRRQRPAQPRRHLGRRRLIRLTLPTRRSWSACARRSSSRSRSSSAASTNSAPSSR